MELERFVAAQEPVWDAVVAELRAGRKDSHWMWFVFPQLKGLGRSETAQHFGLDGRSEALAYLAHPVLGPRLRECCRLLLGLDGTDPERVFGEVDALKLRSSMTVFDRVAPGDVFAEVLDRFYGGERDPRSL